MVERERSKIETIRQAEKRKSNRGPSFDRFMDFEEVGRSSD